MIYILHNWKHDRHFVSYSEYEGTTHSTKPVFDNPQDDAMYYNRPIAVVPFWYHFIVCLCLCGMGIFGISLNGFVLWSFALRRVVSAFTCLDYPKLDIFFTVKFDIKYLCIFYTASYTCERSVDQPYISRISYGICRSSNGSSSPGTRWMGPWKRSMHSDWNCCNHLG